MKIISWNVNGIRAALGHGLLNFVKKENPDILCLQETKANKEQVDHKLDQYEQYWNSAEKPGYSGTAIFSKKKPIKVTNGIGKKEHDKEGRVITAEFPNFYLVNIYVPNSGRGLVRLKYRMKWDNDLKNYLKNLQKKKPVVACGDLNVAHKEIDIARPKQNMKNAGFTDEERSGMTKLLDAGFIDTFRNFNDKPDQYTWWSYMFNARNKNIGWRIDYFIVSKKFMKNIKGAFILQKVMGSDHCPVGIKIK